MTKKLNRIQVNEPNNFSFEFSFSGEGSLSSDGYALHLHDKTELLVLLDGETEFYVDGRVYSLCPGDALVVKPNVLHHCVLPKGKLFEFICCWTDCDTPLLSPIASLTSPLVKATEESAKEVLLCAGYLAYGYKEGEPLKAYSTVMRLLAALAETGVGQSDCGQPSYFPESRTLTEILADVNANFSEIASVKELAARHFVSTATLGRLFSCYLRTTPGLYLETCRLAAARTYLTEGASVSEAAEKAGFSDGSNFIRLFKSRFSCTPGEYRKNFQKY